MAKPIHSRAECPFRNRTIGQWHALSALLAVAEIKSPREKTKEREEEQNKQKEARRISLEVTNAYLEELAKPAPAEQKEKVPEPTFRR